MPDRFTARQLKRIDATKHLRIRAGNEHRFIAVWVVVVADRVLVRSWNDRPNGWYRAFLDQPKGQIEIEGKRIPVRSLAVPSTLARAADAAYAAKYTTKANRPYVEGFATDARRANSLELVPGDA